MTLSASNMPSEHIEQVTFVNEFEKLWPGVRIFAIPNGGFRHKATADKLKAEGVKAGIPDLFIPAWNVWIEMKRQKGGSVSKEQKDWHAYLRSVGHTVIIAKGWVDGINQLHQHHS